MLNKVDLNKLNAFVAVAQQGGITRAAETLLVTRSAVSQSLSALEASLGVKLFNRVAKKLILTAEGKDLFESVLEYQTGLSAALGRVAGDGPKPVEGVVRIGLFIGFSKDKVTDFVSGFLARWPSIRVKILFLPQSELVKRLNENRIDFALSIYRLDRESQSIASARLFREELVLVAGKRHFKNRPSLREIRRMPFIDYYEGGQLARQWIRHHFGSDAGELNIRAFGAAIDFVLELILKDAGAGIVPRSVVARELGRGRLHQIKTGKPELVDSVWFNEVRGFRHSPAAGAFVAEMRAEFRDDGAP